MNTLQRVMLAFLLEKKSGVSQHIISSANIRREWNEDTLKFLVGLYEKKCWEYNYKPFKKAN